MSSFTPVNYTCNKKNRISLLSAKAFKDDRKLAWRDKYHNDTAIINYKERNTSPYRRKYSDNVQVTRVAEDKMLLINNHRDQIDERVCSSPPSQFSLPEQTEFFFFFFFWWALIPVV